MTLIAVLAKPDSAYVMTDTLSYLANMGKLSLNTKHVVLHHANTVMATTGDGVFGSRVKSMLLFSSSLPEYGSLDGMLPDLPAFLGAMWDEVRAEAEGTRHLYESELYLVGWSEEHRTFAAYMLVSDRDFEPERIDGLHVCPTSFAFKPPQLEVDRLAGDLADRDPDLAEFMDQWATRPETPEPTTLEDWVSLGRLARTRALFDNLKHPVGGALHLTHLQPGKASTGRIYNFDDTGDELLELVGYSQHPAAQARPCWCDSGKRHIDCHQARQIQQRCGCGSGQLFRDCCMAPAA